VVLREEKFNDRLFMFSNHRASKRPKSRRLQTASLEPPGGETYHRAMRFDFLFRKFRRERQHERRSTAEITGEDENERYDPENPFPDVVVIEFQDVIDLHSIPPRQVQAVVEDYLEEARLRKTRWVRIIHGKGIGVQREIVRSILARASHVIDFRDAPPEAGGWGATVVELEVDERQ